jgi:putative MATE family efflux protein
VIVDHRDVKGAFARLSLPVAMQMLGDQLLGIVDTIAIGSLGTVALAGATAASTVFITLAFAVYGLASGAGLIAAQRIGAHDVEGFARTTRAGLALPMILAVICFAASLYGSAPIVHALIGDLASAHASAQYLVLRCASLLPMVVSAVLIVSLGAAGNRKLGVYVLVVINLVHVPLMLMLALGWWTHHPYGIAGAGVSSLLSELLGAVYAVIYVARRPVYRIFASAVISWKLAWQCARLGAPEAVFLLAVIVPDVFIVAMLARFGPAVVSAFRALNVVSDLTFVVPVPLQTAVQTVIGQRLGAGDVDAAKEFFRKAQRYAFVITTVTGALAAALAWPLAFLFTFNAAVASIAAIPLALHMVTLPIKGWSMVALAPIRASGDTRFSMLVGIICSALVIPFAWLGIERLHLGLYSVPIGWIAAWAVRAAVTEWKLRDEEWTRRAPLAA